MATQRDKCRTKAKGYGRRLLIPANKSEPKKSGGDQHPPYQAKEIHYGQTFNDFTRLASATRRSSAGSTD